MATQEAVKNAISKPETKLATVFDFMTEKKELIARALPNTITPDRLIGVFTMILNSSPQLMKCSQLSLIGAVIQTVQLGLTPGNVGHCHYIPFNNKQQDGTSRLEVQFLIGYKGMVELVNRSGKACILTAEVVYDKDHFEYEQGLNPVLRHIPAQGDRGQFLGVYCIAKNMLANEKVFIYLHKEDIEKVRKSSKAASSNFSPWTTWFEEMAKKTAVKRICKLLPLSLDIQQKISTDETIKTKIDKDMVEVKDESNWESVQDAEYSSGATAETPKPSAPVNDKAPISEEQRKRLLAIAGSKGHAHEHVKAYILEKYTVDSTMKIPVFLYEEICAHYSKMPDVPAGF